MNEAIYNTGAVGYDEFFGQVTRSYLPALLRAARLRQGQRVLDVATGTGAAAEAAAAIVGPSGSVVGGDVSPDMLAIARQNLRNLPVELQLLDAHRLPFPDGSFDAVLCQLGLMFFADRPLALQEFFRVVQPGGYVAVSVNSTPERSLFLRVGVTIADYVPAKHEMFWRPFSIREPGRLRALFDNAGFSDCSVQSEIRDIRFASFDDYFSGIEKGATVSGQEFVLLPDDVRHAVREAVRHNVPQASGGGPFDINMEVLIGSGRR
jgi:ubiquinone/menaquinone biosynthesis C-methylase UbiE